MPISPTRPPSHLHSWLKLMIAALVAHLAANFPGFLRQEDAKVLISSFIGDFLRLDSRSQTSEATIGVSIRS